MSWLSQSSTQVHTPKGVTVYAGGGTAPGACGSGAPADSPGATKPAETTEKVVNVTLSAASLGRERTQRLHCALECCRREHRTLHRTCVARLARRHPSGARMHPWRAGAGARGQQLGHSQGQAGPGAKGHQLEHNQGQAGAGTRGQQLGHSLGQAGPEAQGQQLEHNLGQGQSAHQGQAGAGARQRLRHNHH
jgi:hypothetical protein